MGLEAGTYINDLNALWPLGPTDIVGQGDDHLRLVKGVLKGTLPNATKPWYFPRVTTKSANYVVTASDDNTTFFVNTAAADVTLTLPAGLAAGATGWQVRVIKSDASTNSVIIAPPSGTINGHANIESDTRYFGMTFEWTGTEFIFREIDPIENTDTLLVASPQDERVAPSGFSSQAAPRLHVQNDVVPLVVNGVGPGQVQVSATPLDMATSIAGYPASGNTVWVDGDNGDDTNTGDRDSPYATLAQAIETSTAPYVMVLPSANPYNPIDSRLGTDNGASVLKIIRAPQGRVRVAVNGSAYPNTLTGSGWVLTSGVVYEWNLGLTGTASVTRVIRQGSKGDRFGYPTVARLRTSIADLQANFATDTNGGWWYDSATTKLYMSFGGVSPGTRFRALYLSTAGTSRMFSQGARWYWEGPFDFEGVQFDLSNSGASPTYCFFSGDVITQQCPRILFPTAGGIIIQGAVMYASGLRIHASENDGINYFAPFNGTTHNFGIEHDIIVTDSGDIDTFGTAISQNRQGSSAHGGADVIRMGSAYIENWGQNVADAATASDTSYTWMVGCYTEDAGSSVGISMAGAGVGANRIGYIDTCRTSGEANASCLQVVLLGSFLYSYNCVLNGGLGTSETDGSGVLGTYLPLAPP